MKRLLLPLIAVMFVLVSFGQDTIIGFSFPTNSTSSLNPNMGLAINNGFQISYYSSDTVTNDTVTYTNGVTAGEYAATATHWDNGMNTKYWLVKFKAPGYSNFTVSSKQRAGGTSNPGPKDFKIQWKLNSGTYTDVTNGTVTVGNDWTTGVASNLLIPSPMLQTNDTMYIRWIMTSNINISSTNVASNGVGKIDDILISGALTTNISNNSSKKEVNIYPNPCNGVFNIESPTLIKEVLIYNILGEQIYSVNIHQLKYHIDINSFKTGIYFIKIKFSDNSIYTSKLSVK